MGVCSCVAPLASGRCCVDAASLAWTNQSLFTHGNVNRPTSVHSSRSPVGNWVQRQESVCSGAVGSPDAAPERCGATAYAAFPAPRRRRRSADLGVPSRRLGRPCCRDGAGRPRVPAEANWLPPAAETAQEVPLYCEAHSNGGRGFTHVAMSNASAQRATCRRLQKSPSCVGGWLGA